MKKKTMNNKPTLKYITQILYWGFIIIAAIFITYSMVFLFKPHPNIYYNNIYSKSPDNKGLTHTVIWAKKDGDCIDARIIIKNNTGEKVEYQPTYLLDCIDKNGEHLYVNECKLKNVYAIPDGESHQLDCVFTIKNKEDCEKFDQSDFNSMKFSVTAEYR